MKKVIYKLILTLLPVTLVVLSLEVVARKVPTSYSVKHNNLIAKKNTIEILVLGSSHANFGINPQFIGSNVYNISNVSQDLYYDLNVLKKYIASCRNIKTVILPISYFTLFSCSLAESVESWRCDYYSAILDIEKPNPQMFYLKKYSYIALMDGPLKIMNGLMNANKLQVNEFGYQKSVKPILINNVINDDSGKTRVNLHHKNMHRKYLTANIKYIEEIASYLNNKHIKLYFVTIPVYKTYYNHMSKEYYDDMMVNVNNISRKYNASYLNYLSDSRFQMDDFMDNDHLNETGAEKFSGILKKDLSI